MTDEQFSNLKIGDKIVSTHVVDHFVATIVGFRLNDGKEELMVKFSDDVIDSLARHLAVQNYEVVT